MIMRKNLLFSALLLGFLMTAPIFVSAQDADALAPSYSTGAVCIYDAFGYKYTFSHLTITGANYKGTGKVDIGAGYLWNVKINGHFGGLAHFLVTNPLADGCASGYTDYFEYSSPTVGTTNYHGWLYGTTWYYSTSGTWLSYCSGSVVGSGTWSATDCAHAGVRPIVKGGPAGSPKK